MVMHFIFKSVSKDQLIESFREGLAINPEAATLGDREQRIYDIMEDVKAGDQVVIDYTPGVGTKFTIKGTVKDTIPGVDVMRAVWTMFIGSNPPSEGFKRGLMGS